MEIEITIDSAFSKLTMYFCKHDISGYWIYTFLKFGYLRAQTTYKNRVNGLYCAATLDPIYSEAIVCTNIRS